MIAPVYEKGYPCWDAVNNEGKYAMPLPEGRTPLGNDWFRDQLVDMNRVTRVEVIDDDGRSYMEYNAEAVQISIQDDGRTLKVFLKKGEK